MTGLLSDYNHYMTMVFDNNTTLIAIVSGIILSGASAIIYKLPDILGRLVHKHMLSSITVDNNCRAYNNIMDNLNIKDSVLAQLGHYTIYSKSWWSDISLLGPGNGTRLIYSRICWYIIRTKTETLNDKLLLVTEFYVPRYASRKFIDYINEISIKDVDTCNTYRVAKMVNDEPHSVRQTNPPKGSLVETRGSSEVYRSINNFINNKARYVDNDVPYKLGLMLYGPPGVGKTSVVRHVAAKYNYDIIVIDTITDLKRVHDMTSDSKYIILIEEIDTMVNDYKNDSENEIAGLMGAAILSDMLKELDGVLMTPGRLLIATTNHLDTLDPALTRPGRFDNLIEFHTINNIELARFVNKYYNMDVSPSDVIVPKDGVSPAEIQNDYISKNKIEFLSKYTI